jgi:hypothetical protein
VLSLHSHQTLEKPAPALFRACEEVPLGTSAHLPQSDTSGHLGGIESALTGAYTLSRAAAGTIVHCCFHAVFANQLARLRRFWFLASAFCQASACDSVQLVHSDDNRHFLCPCSCEDPPSARQIAHDQHSLLTSFAFCTAIFSFRRARCFSSSRFDSLQHISGFLS